MRERELLVRDDLVKTARGFSITSLRRREEQLAGRETDLCKPLHGLVIDDRPSFGLLGGGPTCSVSAGSFPLSLHRSDQSPELHHPAPHAASPAPARSAGSPAAQLVNKGLKPLQELLLFPPERGRAQGGNDEVKIADEEECAVGEVGL